MSYIVSRWPRGVRRGSAAARLLRLSVQIPPGHGCLSLVSVVCCQEEVSATGRLLQSVVCLSVIVKPRRWGGSGPLATVAPWKKHKIAPLYVALSNERYATFLLILDLNSLSVTKSTWIRMKGSTGEQEIGRDLEGSYYGPVWYTTPAFNYRLKKTKKSLNVSSRHDETDLKQVLFEYETRVPITFLRC
jgi:hypothetical protein